MTFTDHEKQTAMKTYRAQLPGHNRPICYRIAESVAKQVGRVRVLDYGCGAKQVHLSHLSTLFGDGNVFGCDFSLEGTREKYLAEKFGVVVVSNVINTLPSESGIKRVIEEISQCLDRDGVAVINYPASPRKAGLSVSDVERLLGEQFIVTLAPRELRGANIVYQLQKR